jgi:hypothetical protein
MTCIYVPRGKREIDLGVNGSTDSNSGYKTPNPCEEKIRYTCCDI